MGKSAKITAYFEENHEEQGIKIQRIFIAKQVDMLTAFFIMDELDD